MILSLIIIWPTDDIFELPSADSLMPFVVRDNKAFSQLSLSNFRWDAFVDHCEDVKTFGNQLHDQICLITLTSCCKIYVALMNLLLRLRCLVSVRYRGDSD